MPPRLQFSPVVSLSYAFDDGEGRSAMESGVEQRNGHIQILIADEHPIRRDSLRALLEKQPDFNVVDVAPDGNAALRLSQTYKPDILLLNLRIPGKDGMGVLADLQSLRIPVRPLLFATSLSTPDLRRALRLGARGVIMESSSTQMLLDGIRGVMADQYWISHELGSSMMEEMQAESISSKGKPLTKAFDLTPRQLEIIRCVVAGCSNADIAAKLSLSEQTVKHHLSGTFDKLGVFNRLELALFAINHGLAEDDS
ncbi:MAG: response regulator transcription factor [Acidobacteriota bacterium]